MELDLKAVDRALVGPVREAMAVLGIGERENAPTLVAESGAKKLTAAFEDGRAVIRYGKKCELFRGLFLLKRLGGKGSVTETPALDSVGLMADNSRNAVFNVATCKRLIRELAVLGFDSLQLYTEDTYEVEGEPYFGYLRGRYSKAELKELDAYAASFGVELVPCVQTLAHLNAIVRHAPYWEINDIEDILLAGDDRTYELIEHMFATLAECFTSRKINIGMDEAHYLGLGKYLDKHGYSNRFDIMTTHLDRVMEICRKYGFQPMMWSDMFFRLAFGGQYYVKGGEVPKEVLGLIPEDVTLVYWDYYSTDGQQYKDMLASHLKLTQNVQFAGGAWKWIGFAPDNRYSLNASRAALNEVIAAGLRRAFVTAWGDNGAECPIFSVLPTLLYYAERAYGNAGEGKTFEAAFETLTGMSLADFFLLDAPNRVAGEPGKSIANACKYFLYNDLFCGLMDCNVAPGDGKAFASYVGKLEQAEKRAGEFSYLFRTLKELCRVLEVKTELGVATRAAYRAGDRAALKALAANEYETLSIRLDTFYRAFRDQWYRENKPHGFDVQDVRLGGLMQRVKSCRERLERYAAGEIDAIPELEEDILDIAGKGSETKVDRDFSYNRWQWNSSVNVY